MKICIIGSGYVGLVTGAVLSNIGNTVYCVDVDFDKINNLNKGIVPIYEPNLEDIIKKNLNKNLHFTCDMKSALKKTDICFIAVGTPLGKNGSANLKYVYSCAKSIGKYMVRHMYVIDKSTVPVGTANKVKNIIQKELDKRNSKLTFDVISNPEFLKEGTAIEDCMNPDRVIIGCDNSKSMKIMHDLYLPLIKKEDLFIDMDVASAEMTKYASNAMLATKVSFINEIANICSKIGADINKVRLGVGKDKRIGNDFLYPGCGYGGSCFPKDIESLINTGKLNGYNANLLKAVVDVNNNQKHILSKMIVARFGENLKNKKFAIWGLSFKPNTDDMREATSVYLINDLTKLGAKFNVYDPKAMIIAKNHYLKDFNNIQYIYDRYECLKNCDALILVTEWDEFKKVNYVNIKKMLKKSIIFDGRNQYNSNELKKLKFEYYQIGIKPQK